MIGFLEYWDTRIIRNQRVFDAHPQIANFAYCECEKIWDHMEAENKALLARHNALRDAVAWERETYMFWEFGRTYTLMANDEALESMFAARAEVDRLIASQGSADCQGEG